MASGVPALQCWWDGPLGERVDGGGVLPDLSESSTAIYTEGISPLDTWRSGSSEPHSPGDWQDHTVSFLARPRCARGFQTRSVCTAKACLMRARALGRANTRRGGRCRGRLTAQPTTQVSPCSALLMRSRRD